MRHPQALHKVRQLVGSVIRVNHVTIQLESTLQGTPIHSQGCPLGSQASQDQSQFPKVDETRGWSEAELNHGAMDGTQGFFFPWNVTGSL